MTKDGGPLTETETELESRLNFLLVEPAIVDKKIPSAVITRRDLGAVVGCFLSDGVRKLATGRSDSVEDVSKTIT